MKLFHLIPIEAFLLLVLFIILYVVYQTIKLIYIYRSVDQTVFFEEKLKITLSKGFKGPFIIRILSKEIIMYYYLFAKTKRIPIMKGLHFTYHKNTSYNIVLGAIIFSAIIESIAFFFLLHHLIPILSWIHTLLIVYALIYITSDYKAILANPITISDKAIHLRLGFRMSEIITIDAFKSIQRVKSTLEETKKDTSVLNMLLVEFEGPNVEIHLKEPFRKKTLLGKERLIHTIHLAIDEHDAFIKEVTHMQLEACS